MAAEMLERKENTVPISLIVIFTILAAGLMAIGYLSSQRYKKQYRIEVEQQLTAIADLKVADLVKWRSERMGDAAVIFNNNIFSNLARRFFENPQDWEVERQLQEWIDEYPKQYEYDQVCLIDPRGETLMSAPAGRPPDSLTVTKRIAEVLQSGRITIVDLYRHDYDKRIYLSLLIPILDVSAGNRAIGVLALRVDPEKYLYPFIRRWPTSSRTAETLLVRREGDEVLYLNELKFRKDAALKYRLSLKMTDIPGVMAVLGRTGIVEGVDHRGESVIADVRGVPDSPWFLVTRMSTSEVYAPARENLWMIVGVVFALLFGSGAGLAFVWRHQSMGYYQERYRAAESLRENKARLDLALQSAFMGVWHLDIIENRRYFDEQVCHLLGINPSKFTGATEEFLRTVHPDDRETLKTALARTIEQDVLYEPEYRTVWPNGSVHYITARGRLVRDDKGRPVKINGIIWDITDRKNAEEALKKRGEQYRTLVENIPDYVMQYDRQHRHIFANTRTLRDYKKTAEEFIGKTHREMGFPPNLCDIWEKALDKVLETGQPQTEVFELENTWGEKKCLEWRAYPEYAPDGSIETVLGISRDITEQKQAGEKLREASLYARSLIETSLDPLVTISADGKITDVNEATAKVTGISRERLIGTDFINYFTEPEKARDGYQLVFSKETVTDYPLTIRNKDGKLTNVLYNASVYRDAVGNVVGVFAAARDITNLKKAEKEREKLINELKDVLANVKTLSGMLPICASCKKIRDDKGYWSQVETYVSEHTEAVFSHGICPECEKKMYAELEKLKPENR